MALKHLRHVTYMPCLPADGPTSFHVSHFFFKSLKESPTVLDVAAAGGEPALSMAKVCLTIIANHLGM